MKTTITFDTTAWDNLAKSLEAEAVRIETADGRAEGREHGLGR